jgi:hypothetical protein
MQHNREDTFSGLILIFGSVANIEERLADNSDDGRFFDDQPFSGLDAKRESGPRPTENRVADLTPLRFCWYFNNNDPRFVAGHILKRDVNVAVRFDFESNYAARESEPLIFNPGALRLLSEGYVRPRPTLDVARCDGLNRGCICRRKRRIVLHIRQCQPTRSSQIRTQCAPFAIREITTRGMMPLSCVYRSDNSSAIFTAADR